MSDDKTVRVAVIGAGHMGRLHAQTVSKLGSVDGSVDLIAVVDVVESRAREVAAATGAESYIDYREVFQEVDAAIVAVPTRWHLEIGIEALRAGLDVLVEKPIAGCLEAAEKLESEALARGRMLHVGLQEWLNPALQAAINGLDFPKMITARRASKLVKRSLDVNVVLDLMIHDIHIVQSVLGEEPERVVGVGTSVLTDSIDEAHAKLEFPRGSTAMLSASRVANERERYCRFFLPESIVHVDLLRQTTTQCTHQGDLISSLTTTVVRESDDGADDVLTLQMKWFLQTIQNRNSLRPFRNAVSALRTALRVCRAIELSDSVS